MRSGVKRIEPFQCSFLVACGVQTKVCGTSKLEDHDLFVHSIKLLQA